MKKISIYVVIIAMVAMACENQKQDLYQDFDYKTVYFPYQTPVRTLSMGEDRIDNSLDKQGVFNIGVSIGGMLENNQDWTVDFKVDNTLTANVFTATTPAMKILPLPAAYYSLSPAATAVIPKGLFNGMVKVQLSDAFFNDTISTTGWYVIPLKMTSTFADSILKGQPFITGADPRIKAQWITGRSPKDWVMYGVKYVNPYHGTYLHRGRDIRKVTATGASFDTVKFHNQYVEKDVLINLQTTGRRKAISNALGNKVGATYSMTLEFSNDKGTPGSIKILPNKLSSFSVTGTGQYQDIATSVESWTGQKWQSMYLQYTYVEGIYTHVVNDTLVFRDRGIKFEENSIVIVP